MKIVTTVYSHPDYYPPTLNAIEMLSKYSDNIYIVSRNVKEDEISFPNNVTLKKSGSFKNIRDSEKASIFWKVKSFIVFSMELYKCLLQNKPNWLIVYDPIPLLAFRLMRPFLSHKPKLWYHNHDVLEKSFLKKYSISWFAYKMEQNSFNYIDIFTLPSEERKAFFPLKKLKGQYFFLPNYPLLANRQKNLTPKNIDVIKLIYQGHVSEGHGLMEIIKYIKRQGLKLPVYLTIIGPISDQYKTSLKDLIHRLGLQSFVSIMNPIAFPKLLSITKSHDIGIAINQPINIQYQTGSTSSNKIYEYVSCGLPVLLYNDEVYRQKIGTAKWAFFTDLSDESLNNNLMAILNGYKVISKSALEDFENELNFECHFFKILTTIIPEVKCTL